MASGRSPYDYGDYICGDNGCPLDFVSALHFINEQMEWFQSLSEEEKEALRQENIPQYDTEQDELVFCAGSFTKACDPDEELPFR